MKDMVKVVDDRHYYAHISHERINRLGGVFSYHLLRLPGESPSGWSLVRQTRLPRYRAVLLEDTDVLCWQAVRRIRKSVDNRDINVPEDRPGEGLPGDLSWIVYLWDRDAVLAADKDLRDLLFSDRSETEMRMAAMSEAFDGRCGLNILDGVFVDDVA
jgi:hypothetical protein